MPAFMKGSKVLGFIAGIFSALKRGYVHSRFKLFADKTAVCFKNSFIARLLSAYFNKNPYFEYSLTYRFILWLVKVFDVPIRATGRFFTFLTKGSVAAEAANSLAESGTKDRLLTGGVIGIFLAAGYGIGMAIKGGSVTDFVPVLLVCVFALLVFGAAHSLDWIKGSLIYRFFAWLGLVK